MKTSFSDFIETHPNCGKFAGNAEAILVFEYLSKDDSIIRMIDSCESGKPALAPVAKELEALIDSVANPTISFDDPFTKQTVGLMIKSILAPFGYKVSKQKILPKESVGKFASASCYVFDPSMPASMKVVKRIESI